MADRPPRPSWATPMRRFTVTIVVLVSAGLALAAASLLVGGASLADERTRAVLIELRANRTACAALAGAALAVAGCLMQGLFRNPLASPSVLGTTAGAALGGQAVLLAHGAVAAALPAWLLPEMALPLGCMLGAGASLALLLAISGRATGPIALLLAGFVLGSLLTSVGACLTALAQDAWELGRAMVRFTLGGVDGKGGRHVLLALPLVCAGAIAAWGWGRPLDLLLAGEDEARALGVDVRATRLWTLVWVAVLVAAATAIGGGVPFVGLVVPHALRPFVGHAHRRLIPAAVLAGAAFLIACDLAARLAPLATGGGELPLGVVTGLVGAPVFLALLVRSRREAW